MKPQHQTHPLAPSRLRRALGAVSTAILVAVVSHATLASAQTAPASVPQAAAPDGPWMHRGHGIQRLLAEAGVTPAQREQLRALRKKAWEQSRPEVQQMHALMRQRMQLLAAPTIDRAALDALRDKQMALADQLSRQRTQMEYEMAQILTPEQRAKLYALMQQRMERMRRQHGMHPGEHGSGPMGGPGMMR